MANSGAILQISIVGKLRPTFYSLKFDEDDETVGRSFWVSLFFKLLSLTLWSDDFTELPSDHGVNDDNLTKFKFYQPIESKFVYKIKRT